MLQSVETVLQQGTPFTHAKVALWQATIVENALKRLAAQNKPFKYVGERMAMTKFQTVGRASERASAGEREGGGFLILRGSC